MCYHDSTYLLIHIVRDLGLNPLAVHVDNGWNTGLASRNMSNMLKTLGVDLHTEVLDWDEFRLMQIAVLKSRLENSYLHKPKLIPIQHFCMKIYP